MIEGRSQFFLMATLGWCVFSAPLRAWDWGDTKAPYNVVFGRSVKFPGLMKADLGLRCTVFIRKASLPLPARDQSEHPDGMIVSEGGWTVVNGEFNELGKHYLLVAWFSGERSGSFFPIAEGDIDRVVLQQKY